MKPFGKLQAAFVWLLLSANLALGASISTPPVTAPNGAGLVGFQSAWTGATARTVKDKLSESISVKDFGAKGNGTNDDTASIQAAINTATTTGVLKVDFPRGAYKVTSTLFNTAPGLRLSGAFGDRSGVSNYGAEIQCTGTGACIQNGTDNGHAWNAADYDGPQGLVIENLSIRHMARDTSLANGQGQYKAGSYGIRDWRGGNIWLNNVNLEGFENNFWGVQSDINRIDRVTSLYSRYGIYLGPRSDQNTISDLYTFYCDNAIVIDGAFDTRINNAQIVGNGTATLHAVLIRQGSGMPSFNQSWFEHLQGYAGTDQIAFIGAGTEAGYAGNTSAVKGLILRDPFFYTNVAGVANHTKYMIELGKATGVVLENPMTATGSGTNLDAYIAFQAGTAYTSADAQLTFRGHAADEAKIYVNNGTGSPDIHYSLWGNAARSEASITGRLQLKRVGAVVNGSDSLQIGTEGVAGGVYINQPNYAGGQTARLTLRKSTQELSAMPSSGTYEQGDYVRNTAPVINTWSGGFAGLAGAKYITRGWMRITTGASHVLNTDWVEDRALTGQ